MFLALVQKYADTTQLSQMGKCHIIAYAARQDQALRAAFFRDEGHAPVPCSTRRMTSQSLAFYPDFTAYDAICSNERANQLGAPQSDQPCNARTPAPSQL